MLISSCMILKLNNFSRVFVGFIYILGLVLLVSFLTSNYLIFYFFFEASLIPTLLIITGWGFQPERLQAGVYFIVYTLVGSLPLLVSLFFFYFKVGSLNITAVVNLVRLGYSFRDFILGGSLIMAFLVKMPMFIVHL